MIILSVESICMEREPCLNNGHCIPTGGDKYYCDCENGYHGTHCEEGKNSWTSWNLRIQCRQ